MVTPQKPDSPAQYEVHNKLRYQTYANIVKKPVDARLQAEFDELYAKYGSNSAVFAALGKPSGFWMEHYSQLDQSALYKPIADIYETLDKLRRLVPISLFTNARPDILHKTLAVVKVEAGWFTHIISGDDIKKRKPDLEGFRLIIEKSGLPAQQILYIGDRVNADIKPAHAVGMQTCLVYTTAPEADYSFINFKDILSIF